MFKLLPTVLPKLSKLSRTNLSFINYATTIRYTKSHEYIEYDHLKPIVGTIGISNHARKLLGDIVYVEFPKQDDQFEKDGEFVIIETVKSVVECKIPVDGKILEVNDIIYNDLNSIDSHPEDDKWLTKIEINKPSQLDELMDEAKYAEYLQKNTSSNS